MIIYFFVNLSSNFVIQERLDFPNFHVFGDFEQIYKKKNFIG